MKPLFKRSTMMLVIFLTLFGSIMRVTPAYASTLTVSNTNDSGAGSLRQAILDAAPSDTIDFDASLAGATIHLASPIPLSQNVTIDGSALAVPVTISGDSDNDGMGDVMIFTIDAGVTVVINSLVLAKGNAANDSGGAISSSGTVTINNSMLVGNYALYSGAAVYSYGSLTVNNSSFIKNTAAYGGGAIQAVGTLNITNSTFSYNYTNSGGGGGAIYSAATTTVTDSTFTHNTASTVQGGGIYVVNGTTTVANSTFAYNDAAGGASIMVQTGTLNVSNSTFANNTSTGISGGIYNYGTATLTNNTFSNNSASVGADIANSNVLNFSNNLIANTVAGVSCYNSATITTNLNNWIEDTSPTCAPAFSGDPLLGPLTDNGGPTQTMALLLGSTAIDMGDNPTCAAAPVNNLDQRGLTRPVGTNCDIGAFEYRTTYVVSNASDPGDGTCDLTCSLRDAITAANGSPTIDTVHFDGDYTIMLASALPSPTDDLTIDGSGHTIVIDGASSYNIVDSNASLHLKNLTIQHASYINGGAVVIHSPSTITNVTFANNTSSNNGGALYTLATLSITNSTFIGNSTNGGGGAIKNDNATLIISNSTFSSNSADIGGAIIALGGAATTTLRNTTFSGNSATTLAGGVYTDGTFNYANTIIANSIGGDCVYGGTLGINLNNLVENGGCFATLSGDPNLGALAANGGSTQTFALLPGSTAINAGNDAICVASPVSGFDQRGVVRPQISACDIGAYEYVDATVPTISSFTASSPTNSLNIPITAFSASDNMTVTGYKITETNFPPAAVSAGWTVSPPSTYTVASTGDYDLYPWAKDASGNVSALYGSPAAVTVETTAPTVSSIALVNPSPTNKASVSFTVTFSEAVTGISTADFTLTKTGSITGATVSGVSGSGATRTVTVNTGSGDGTLRLDLPVSATVTDTAGNSLSGLPYTSGPSYTVNKTLTFTSAAATDGWVLESSETSNVGGTLDSAATTFRLGDDAAKKQYRGILSFSTASIPDTAVITGVMLNVKKGAVAGGGDPVSIFQGFFADVKTGFFTASALQISDFQTAGSKTVGPTSPTPSANWYSINLINAKTFINKLATNAGLTQIRLRFKLDDNGNTIANYMTLFSGNAGAANRPQLVIKYYVP